MIDKVFDINVLDTMVNRQKIENIHKAFEEFAQMAFSQAGISITEERYEDFFSDTDPFSFKVNAIADNEWFRNNIELMISALVDFLNFPKIKDTLGSDHDARRDMRKQLAAMDLSAMGGHATNAEFFEAYTNKYKKGVLSWTVGIASMLAYEIESYYLMMQKRDITPPTLESQVMSIKRAAALLPDVQDYDDFSEDQKEQAVTQARESVVKILGHLRIFLQDVSNLKRPRHH